MNLGKLFNHYNFIPYLLIIPTLVVVWLLWERGNTYKDEAEQAKVDAATAVQAVSEDVLVLQEYMNRTVQVKQITKQRKGTYEIILAGDKPTTSK